MKKLELFALMTALQFATVASAFTLTGKVSDGTNPVPYTSIYVKENPQNGTISDFDGVFDIPDFNEGQSIVVSFIGYRTMELKFKKQPKDTINITLVEQPILLAETSVNAKNKKMSHRKQMKAILKDVKAQMDKDFPDDNIMYNVVSDYGVYNEGAAMAVEDVGADIVEIPGAGDKGKDLVQLRLNWINRYRDDHIQSNYEKLDSTLKKKQNAKLIHYADSSRWVHKFLWGSGVKYLFNRMSDTPGRWDTQETDSVLVLTYTESHNILGIAKGELVLNYILNPYSYRVYKLSQSLVVDLNIPFGYKLTKEQLAMLNTLIIGGDALEKYRVKKAHIDVKRNILYIENSNRMVVKEKNVLTNIHIQERKGNHINFKQTGSIKVNDVKIGVSPLTKNQIYTPYKLTLKPKP